MKALLELAGAASNELNQPLQIYAEIILHEREGMLEERRRGIEEIQEQVKYMSRILWNLKHLARYETREYTGDMNIIALGLPVIEDCAMSLGAGGCEGGDSRICRGVFFLLCAERARVAVFDCVLGFRP
jgi:hypothetical protein